MDTEMYTDDEEHYSCDTDAADTSTRHVTDPCGEKNPKPKIATRPALKKGNTGSRKRKQKHDPLSEGFKSVVQEERRHKLAKSKRDSDTYSTSLEQRCEILEQETAQLRKELLETNNKVKHYEKQINTLASSLASEMNKKVSANESSLENISIQCRPMNIVEEYSNLCSNAWLDAKQAFDDMDIEQETSTKFLSEIMVICHKVAETCFRDTMSTVAKLLQFPLDIKREPPVPKMTPDRDSVGTSNRLDMPQDVITVLGDHLRRKADIVNIDSLQMKVKETLCDKVKKFSASTPVVKEAAVCLYVDQACRLAWKMVLQRPQMTFAQADVGRPFKGEKDHPLAWGSNPSRTALVRYYQYPSLLHGTAPMVKGKVFVN